MKLDKRSLAALRGVQPELVSIATQADSIADEDTGIEMQIIEGVRSPETQARYLKSGASKTTNSRHLTGHAFDFAVKVNGKLQDKIHPYYAQQAALFKRKAKELGYKITWGGDWGWDGMHIELDWEAFPLKNKPKTPGNSTTVAAATVGVPLATYLPELITEAKSLTGLFDAVGEDILGYIQIGLLAVVVLYIVSERVKKMNREGV